MPDAVTANFKDMLLGFVSVYKKAEGSVRKLPDTDQASEVYPPRIYPVVVLITVSVFPLPSQSEWNVNVANPSRDLF